LFRQLYETALTNPVVGIVCCARAASGQATAAPPTNVMKSRRRMCALLRLRAHITTPLRKNAAVHHSKNCALMSQMGQSRRNKAASGFAGCPLCLQWRPNFRSAGNWRDVPQAAIRLRAPGDPI
jgi:hypothetical protein